ncbi:MAG TPA: YdeI/OmpD-associated family protein [Steroidobacteraceae bacterium]|nr:YdeI/OmpD-associated family protein [Steroidobacteraceae bacterium]
MNPRTFATIKSLESWMRTHHARAPLDVMLCWGWIDGLRRGFDDRSFLQRYTPRRAKSIWSQVNREAFTTLSRMNLFALAFRTQNMKTPEGRAKKIATLVAMLARGETIVPQKK